ncbi:MAG: mechanosensitive ion channel family protein [Desulfatiglandales bacterium]
MDTWMGSLIQIGKEMIKPLAVLGGGILLGLTVYAALSRLSGRLARLRDDSSESIFIRRCRGPARLILPLLSVWFVFPFFEAPDPVLQFLRHILVLLLIFSLAWLMIRLLGVAEHLLIQRFTMDVADNLRARSVQTQIRIMKKIAIAIIGIIALSLLLMSFATVRQVGASILASAGIVGLIIGFAAQHSIATLLAGLQIAFTQPIRLDDVVIVENEWGRIEEITLTYVVVRIWDMRRLVLPITYFLEKPFQNWTRVSADLLGTVYLYADYNIPVQALRERLKEVLSESELWDGKVWGLQVTNATEQTQELRALMSAPDASTAWNLRCHVREKLIEYARETFPEGLPRVRAEIHADRSDDGVYGRRKS